MVMRFPLVSKKNHYEKRSIQSGFSLIELMVVMGIIAILASIVVGISQGVAMRQELARARADLYFIAAKLNDFKSRYKDYPRSDGGSEAEGVVLTEALLGKIILKKGTDGKLKPFEIENKDAKPLVGSELKIIKDDGNELIVDPWGNPYYYRYEEPYALDAEKQNIGGKWENPGFILISAGPDGFYSRSGWQQGFDTAGIDERTGEFNVKLHLDHPANHDNIVFGAE
jgi:prepilin-type N-terminal cleavage/methylation domain-containing protein